MEEPKTIKITSEQLNAMSPADRNNALLKAVKVEGFGVVRRADGSIKYDDVALKGTYKEGEIA